MIHLLIDHNIEGQGIVLWGALASEGWVELLQIRISMFVDVGLPFDSSDRDVWRFAQKNGMVLITDNRNMDGADSLEQTLRDEAVSSSLPVLTIGKVDRFDERDYRERCINRSTSLDRPADRQAQPALHGDKGTDWGRPRRHPQEIVVSSADRSA